MCYKVKSKKMDKAKKNYTPLFRGIYVIIAVRVNCTPKYVSMVLNDKLGKYSGRDTSLAKQIRSEAAEIEQLLRPKK
jgi:hypothetical protein